MYKVNKILFPAELATISSRIAPHVRYRAEKFSAEVHVLHVIPDPVQFASVFYVEPQLLRTQEALVKEAAEHLDRFLEENDLKSATKAIMIGDTVEAILEYIGRHQIDQVIMGTHGRKGLERIIIGSVARRLVRRSPVPVLTVNPYLMDETEKTRGA